MRSSGIIQLGPESNDKCAHKRKTEGDLGQRLKRRGQVKTEEEIRVTQPQQK